MQPYNQKLIINSRTLRTEMRDAERLLWKCVRSKQMRVLRFDNRQVLIEIEAVLAVIDGAVDETIGQREGQKPPKPDFINPLYFQ